MPTVVSIALNPSVDKSTTISALVPEKKMYCPQPDFHPGGGGINVARALVRLGTSVCCLFPEGGFLGNQLKEMLSAENVPILPVAARGNTRENWIVKDKENGKQYHFVMPGAALQNDEWKSCLSRIEKIDNVDYIVLSGSMPDEYPENIFDELADIALRKKARLIVDTKGPALKKALENGVYLIKPNQSEFLALADLMELKAGDLRGKAKELIGLGLCDVIVISLGAMGAVLATPDRYVEFSIPAIKTNSVVGAGDSMVAGIIHCLARKTTLEEAIEFGLCCGTAATLNQGTELFHTAELETMRRHIIQNSNNSPVYSN